MNAVFGLYPDLASVAPVSAPMKAGSASFHNGLCIHGAGPNMTTAPRRAMTCAFMPDGSRYNGKANVLPEEYRQTLVIGDLLDNDGQNPLIYAVAAGQVNR
jgi:ectoine hydroxylase-related dioxygenase (phytanoyl-CoA dioxygenase family)